MLGLPTLGTISMVGSLATRSLRMAQCSSGGLSRGDVNLDYNQSTETNCQS